MPHGGCGVGWSQNQKATRNAPAHDNAEVIVHPSQRQATQGCNASDSSYSDVKARCWCAVADPLGIDHFETSIVFRSRAESVSASAAVTGPGAVPPPSVLLFPGVSESGPCPGSRKAHEENDARLRVFSEGGRVRHSARPGVGEGHARVRGS